MEMYSTMPCLINFVAKIFVKREICQKTVRVASKLLRVPSIKKKMKLIQNTLADMASIPLCLIRFIKIVNQKDQNLHFYVFCIHFIINFHVFMRLQIPTNILSVLTLVHIEDTDQSTKFIFHFNFTYISSAPIRYII